MDFQALKLGFQIYLEGLQETSNKDYVTSNSDISIFMYANEFKNYLSDELNCDASIFSKSISEILDMEIVDGKLVDPNSNNDQIVIDDGPAIGNNGENGAVIDDGPAMGNDGNIAINDGPAIGNNGENGAVIDDQENLLTNILNDLLQDSTFKDTLDLNKDGEIDSEELGGFLDAIKNYDSDASNISIEDLMSAVQDIKDGVFEFASDEEISEVIGETPQADEAGITNSAGGGSGSFNVPSTYSAAQNKFAGTQEKTLENMTKDELNSELSTAEKDLSEKQSALSAILDGSDSEIQKLQQVVDDNYELYHNALEEVDKDMADQLDTLKEAIDAKEDEIDAKEQEIADQESTVSDCKNALENATSTRENLESILETLNGADTSNMDSDQLASLEQKKADVSAKLEDAKKAEEAAQKALDEAEAKLEELNEEKTTLESTDEGQLGDLNQQMTELEAQIAEQYPEIKEYMDAYNESKQDLAEYKQNAISEAKSAIQESQDYVNEVKTAINNYDNKQDTKEFCLSDDLSDELLEFAYKMLGYSEGQVEGQCGYNLPDGLWCAAFVKYCLTETYGGDLPSWYTNCNFNSCSEVLAAANNNGCAFRDANDAQPGDLIIFNTSRGTARHIGIVVSVDPDGTIHTIEGNTSSHVGERTYQAGSSSVNSFVRVMGNK